MLVCSGGVIVIFSLYPSYNVHVNGAHDLANRIRYGTYQITVDIDVGLVEDSFDGFVGAPTFFSLVSSEKGLVESSGSIILTLLRIEVSALWSWVVSRFCFPPKDRVPCCEGSSSTTVFPLTCTTI